jgi:hypothetical protein
LVILPAPRLSAIDSDTLSPLTLEEVNTLSKAEADSIPVVRMLDALEWSPKMYNTIVQGALLDLRYYFSPPSGEPSPALTASIKAFQRDVGHEPTGMLLMGEFRELGNRSSSLRPPDVYLGSNHVAVVDDWVVAKGTWVPEGTALADPLQTTKIECDREVGSCIEATATLADRRDGQYLSVDLVTWQIADWTESHIFASSHPGLCVDTTMIIDLQTKGVTAVRRPKGTQECRDFELSSMTLRLGDATRCRQSSTTDDRTT